MRYLNLILVRTHPSLVFLFVRTQYFVGAELHQSLSWFRSNCCSFLVNCGHLRLRIFFVLLALLHYNTDHVKCRC